MMTEMEHDDDILLMEEDLVFSPLTAHDRCDSCIQPAMAQVFISIDLDIIKFCGHHFHKNEAVFLARGYLVSQK
jgi:hypothetical protein